MAEGNGPGVELDGPAAPPRRNGEIVFAAPWQSRIFGLTMALHAAGTFTWDEFRARLIAAIGRPAFVTPDFIKPGATVVDVGTSRVADRNQVAAWFGESSQRLIDFDKRGSAVVGDVHPAVAAVAGALTPVPGGVGPLTIAMLLRNTLVAAEQNPEP